MEFQNAFDRLPGNAAIAAGLDEGHGGHDRHLPRSFGEQLLNRKKCRLGVQGIENGLDEQEIDATVEQSAHLVAIGTDQFGIGRATGRRVIGICRHGGVLVVGPIAPATKQRRAGCFAMTLAPWRAGRIRPRLWRARTQGRPYRSQPATRIES